MNSCSEIRRLYVVQNFRYRVAKFPLILLLMTVSFVAMTNAFYLPVPWTRYLNRCGGQPMEAMVHVCCDGRRQNVPLYEASECYGKTVYTTKDKMCCGRRIRYKNWFSACCGTDAYDDRGHFCCLGLIHENTYRQPACCGDQPFEGQYYRCCVQSDIRRDIRGDIRRKADKC